MVQVLFCLHIASLIGMLFMPLTATTQGRALLDWLKMLAFSALSGYTLTRYTSWEPNVYVEAGWAVIAWAFGVIGLVIAICKSCESDTTEV